MTRDQVCELLELAAAYDDRRPSSPAAVDAWFSVLGGIRFTDARDAVATHYATTARRVMPADIQAIVTAVRRCRLEHTPIPAPPVELADEPTAYRDWLRTTRDAIANGEYVKAVA